MTSTGRLGMLLVVGVAFAAAPAAGNAQEGELTVSAGFDFNTGEYYDVNGEETDVLSFPLSVKYERNDWIGKVSTSYLRIDGPGVPQGGQEVGGDESGVGDVIVGLSRLFYPSGSELPLIELTGKVKLPTASESRGLGTGKTDFSGQLDVSKTYGRVTPFATLGYKLRGGDLDDGFYASLGGGYRITDSVSAGLIYDFQQRAVDDVFQDPDGVPTSGDEFFESTEDSHELVPYLNFKVRKGLRVQSYGVIGLSDNSPDYGLGTSVSVDF